MNSLAFSRSHASSLPTELNRDQPAVRARARRPIAPAIARGLALFLGGFSLINPLGEIFIEHFDASIWWLDLAPILRSAESPLLIVIGLALLAYGIRPSMSPRRRIATIVVTGFALFVALVNGAIFYILLLEGAFSSAFPFPLSLLIAAALGTILTSMAAGNRRPSSPRPILTAITLFAAFLSFPLLQMFCFGKTDYRRPADAVVVLGAKAYADGTPSVPLADRVRTACELYHDGLASTLIFSGGPGDGAIHEPESMRRYALAQGVPDGAIILDPAGLNTQATVDNSLEILRTIGARRVMVVSNFYHLPRIKMTYQRQGWNVFTVPARESYTLTALPYYMAREIAGLWVYYVSAIWK
jgi:uncharacterized SAM-binding protein YcdF (DUF218 family)